MEELKYLLMDLVKFWSEPGQEVKHEKSVAQGKYEKMLRRLEGVLQLPIGEQTRCIIY